MARRSVCRQVEDWLSKRGLTPYTLPDGWASWECGSVSICITRILNDGSIELALSDFMLRAHRVHHGRDARRSCFLLHNRAAFRAWSKAWKGVFSKHGFEAVAIVKTVLFCSVMEVNLEEIYSHYIK